MPEAAYDPQAPIYLTRPAAGVALIHLHRPPVNSYDRQMLDALNGAIDELRWNSELRGAVLVSDLAPRIFCAGTDITALARGPGDQRAMLTLHGHEILRKFERTPKIIVAAISGHALGGGLELALACDRRFAAAGEYTLGLPEVNLGLLPGNGGTQRLPRMIGRTTALDMMLTGRSVTPQQARQIGLVDCVVPAEQVVAEAIEYVAQLAAGPTGAIGTIKLATTIGGDLPLDGALALEREAIWRLFESDDAAEGLAAFLAKRSPHWTGP